MKDITELVKAAGARPGVARLETGSRVARETGITAPEGDALPPSGNTGVRITTARAGRARPVSGVGVSLGWLSATWRGFWASPDDFLEWAGGLFGALEYCEGRRWRGYDHTWMGEHGVLAGVRWDNGLEVHLDVPATPLEALRPGQIVALVEHLHKNAVNVPRLDVTLDDWMKVKMPAELYAMTSSAENREELVRDELVTRAKSGRLIASVGRRGGDTWELGARTGGGNKLRVYDKNAESGGEVDAVRWELQLRDDAAHAALGSLAQLVRQEKAAKQVIGAKAFGNVLGGWVASQMVNFLDFRNRYSDSNITRADRLVWWAALVLNAKKAKMELVKPGLTINRMHEHAYSNMAGMIATLADSAEAALGLSPGAWFAEIVRLGREKRSPKHRLALRSAGVAF